MRLVLLLLGVGGVSACASPFPIRTCSDAKRATAETCGFAAAATWACWDETELRGTGEAIPEPLFRCLDGATTCFEVESCLRNLGWLSDRPPVPAPSLPPMPTPAAEETGPPP
jgi:hypothetical protein